MDGSISVSGVKVQWKTHGIVGNLKRVRSPHCRQR